MNKIIFFILTLVIFSNIACQSNKDYLVKIYEGNFDEVGVKSGYINQKGDTVIPLNKYLYCYTDTLKNYAIVLEHSGKCIAIDVSDNMLFEVYWFDNGPDYLSDGLFRIIQKKKIGYANSKGEIVIKPQFECADQFNNGRAKVAYKCKLIQNGEHSQMVSDEWFFINKKGIKIIE